MYQGRWSLACRDMERDIIPLIKHEGMGIPSFFSFFFFVVIIVSYSHSFFKIEGIAPWGVLGQGMFKTDEELARIKETGILFFFSSLSFVLFHSFLPFY